MIECDPETSIFDAATCSCIPVPPCKCWIFFFIDYWNLKTLATDKFVFPTAECNLECDPFTSIFDSYSCECIPIPSCKCWIFFIICRLLSDPDYSTLDSDSCTCVFIKPCKSWVIWSQLFKIWKLSQKFSYRELASEDFSYNLLFPAVTTITAPPSQEEVTPE